MVTTFNDRIINLKRSCAPIVGKPTALLPSKDPLNGNKNITPPRGLKRQAPSTCSDDKPPYLHHMSAKDAEHRRRKHELNYTASTVQQELKNAGRPQVSLFTRRVRALPSNVNTDGCMVISSTEYDASAAAAVTEHYMTATNAHDTVVDEMLSYAALIQSTRQYYGLVVTASHITPSETTNIKEQYGANNNYDEDDEEELRASSDATSTWTPTPICNQVNLNDKKTIDNDNRSDGMSSNPQSSGEEESSDISFFDQCEGAESSSSPIILEKDSSNSNLLDIGIIGNDDVSNNGNHNRNDRDEDNYSQRNLDATFFDSGLAFFAVG